MPTVTVEGEKSFEVEPGKKLVLAIEDAGKAHQAWAGIERSARKQGLLPARG